jgi:hypothetical protein
LSIDEISFEMKTSISNVKRKKIELKTGLKYNLRIVKEVEKK